MLLTLNVILFYIRFRMEFIMKYNHQYEYGNQHDERWAFDSHKRVLVYYLLFGCCVGFFHQHAHDYAIYI